MNAEDLNAAMQYIDDEYLDIAAAPQKEIIEMSKTKTISRIFLFAAVAAMLAVCAYAADFLQVQSLYSGTRTSFAAFSEMEKAMKEAGFRIDVKEKFATGYSFEEVDVKEVRGSDENDREILTYSSIAVYYRNEAGKRLLFAAEPELAEIAGSPSHPVQSKNFGKIRAEYIVDHYKNVPEDYEPTEEDKLWMEQPGNYISYGSDEVEETAVAFLHWTKDGIRYTIMDPRGTEQPENLFAMAEALILGK